MDTLSLIATGFVGLMATVWVLCVAASVVADLRGDLLLWLSSGRRPALFDR